VLAFAAAHCTCALLGGWLAAGNFFACLYFFVVLYLTRRFYLLPVYACCSAFATVAHFWMSVIKTGSSGCREASGSFGGSILLTDVCDRRIHENGGKTARRRQRAAAK
jgi:hypothetical protein